MITKIKKINEELFKGDKVIYSPYTPKMKWKGSKIPLHLLEEVKAFLLYAHKELHIEAMVKLFFNSKEQEWLVFVPYQEGTGASTNEIQNGKNKEAREIDIPADYMLMGSIHSHCNMSAFASGVDEADETNIPGLHITFGNMDDEIWSIHKRVSFGKNFYNASITNWFAFPKWKNIDDRMLEIALRLKPIYGFNEKWKERVSVKRITNSLPFDNRQGLLDYSFDYYGYPPKKPYVDSKDEYGKFERLTDPILKERKSKSQLREDAYNMYDNPAEEMDSKTVIDNDNVILSALQILIRTYGIHMQEIINMEVTGNNPIFEDDLYVDKYEKNRETILQFIYIIAQENDISMEELFS